MNSSPRPHFTPHLLRVRTPGGTVLEVDIPPIYQSKLAVQRAYSLAHFLAGHSAALCADSRWKKRTRKDLKDVPVDPLTCTVEVWRRVPEDYPGAVHGYALLCEVPVAPAVPSVGSDPAPTYREGQ